MLAGRFPPLAAAGAPLLAGCVQRAAAAAFVRLGHAAASATCQRGLPSPPFAWPSPAGPGAQFLPRLFSASVAALARKKPDPKVVAQREQFRALKKDTSFQPPKRPPTAYILFSSERFKQNAIKRSDGKTDTAKTSKAIGKLWHALSLTDKQKYIDRSDALRAQYDKDLAEFDRNKKPADYVKEKALARLSRKFSPARRHWRVTPPAGMPVRPLSSYMLWVKSVYAASEGAQKSVLGKTVKEMTFAEKGKALGKAWKAMDALEKERFQTDAKAQLEVYKEEHKRYAPSVEKTRKELKLDLQQLAQLRRERLKKTALKRAAVRRKGGRRASSTSRRRSTRRRATPARKKATTKRRKVTKKKPAAKKRATTKKRTTRKA